MVWVSGGKLAAASANSGILGIVGAGSMKGDLLDHHLKKARTLTLPEKQHALAVNIPLLYEGAQEQIQVALKNNIKIFFTSAGSPKKFTPMLKDQGCIVIHVTSTPELAQKCEQAGVDAIVAEGFEAGGHNGRDELTTLVLIPQVVDVVKIPVIAAGGIADGRGLLSMLALGACGVQMGTRFVATEESSAHPNYKQALIKAGSTATMLAMKKVVPVRLLKNHFYDEVFGLEQRCASEEEFKTLLGQGRAKKGMLEGDLQEGELEIGQICSMIKDIPTVSQLVQRIIQEYQNGRTQFLN